MVRADFLKEQTKQIMISAEHWISLRRGNAAHAISILQDAYKRDPSASHTVGLGVAYLWVNDYGAASEHFEHAIRTDPSPVSIYYGMAGTSYWCAERPGAAVRTWNGGLDARFTDGSGGVHLPLLMLVASILRLEVFRKEAQQLLKERTEESGRKGWLKNWPGPLAKFAVGAIDKNALIELCVANSEQETVYRKWLAQFYLGVIEYGRGNISPTELREVLHGTADISKPEWSVEREFLRLLWSEEFFIARCEASLDMNHWLALLRGSAAPPWVR